MRRVLFVLATLLVFCRAAHAAADAPVVGLPPGSTLVGTITLTSASIMRDPRARRELQAIVPALLERGRGKMVRLEGHSGSGRTRAEYVKKSLLLAKEVERYLRLEQKVNLDLYLAAVDDRIPPRAANFVRIVVYPQEFREMPGVTQVIGE